MRAGSLLCPTRFARRWDARVEAVLGDATLTRPEGAFAHRGGRSDRRHSEHLGHMLTQMQWLQRAYPGATW